MNLKINGKEYKIKYTLRALIIFEKIANKPFSIATLTEQILFLYSLLLANNTDMTLTIDELIDAIDNDKQILQDYLAFITNKEEKGNLLNHGDDPNDDKKKE